jgi:hypothetical protein
MPSTINDSNKNKNEDRIVIKIRKPERHILKNYVCDWEVRRTDLCAVRTHTM